jgi:hypothetical protein
MFRDISRIKSFIMQWRWKSFSFVKAEAFLITLKMEQLQIRHSKQ